MRRSLMLAAAVLTLGACVPVPVVYTVTSCKVDGFPALIGRPADAATGQEILRVSIAKRLRWITPGMMVTQEYDPERVSAWVGPDGTITKLNCG